ADRGRRAGRSGRDARPPSGRVEAPASSYRTYEEGNLFRVSVPANWQELTGSTNSVTFAPEGAYGSVNGQSTFTHGIEFGVDRNTTHDLETETEGLIDSLSKGNPNLSRPSRFDRVKVAGRRGLRTVLQNQSEATGQAETIELVTTQMADGNLFYSIGVAPSGQYSSYRDVFDRIRSSIQLQDHR